MTAMTEPSYEDQAAQFIADTERYAALGLPELPDDPAAAAAMRAAGYEVLADCTAVKGHVATVWLAADDHESSPIGISAQDLARAIGIDAAALPGTEFIATLRETPEGGRSLRGFRPLPG